MIMQDTLYKLRLIQGRNTNAESIGNRLLGWILFNENNNGDKVGYKCVILEVWKKK